MTQITAYHLRQEPIHRASDRPSRPSRVDAAGVRADPYLWLLVVLSVLAFGCGASAFAQEAVAEPSRAAPAVAAGASSLAPASGAPPTPTVRRAPGAAHPSLAPSPVWASTASAAASPDRNAPSTRAAPNASPASTSPSPSSNARSCTGVSTMA